MHHPLSLTYAPTTNTCLLNDVYPLRRDDGSVESSMQGAGMCVIVPPRGPDSPLSAAEVDAVVTRWARSRDMRVMGRNRAVLDAESKDVYVVDYVMQDRMRDYLVCVYHVGDAVPERNLLLEVSCLLQITCAKVFVCPRRCYILKEPILGYGMFCVCVNRCCGVQRGLRALLRQLEPCCLLSACVAGTCPARSNGVQQTHKFLAYSLHALHLWQRTTVAARVIATCCALGSVPRQHLRGCIGRLLLLLLGVITAGTIHVRLLGVIAAETINVLLQVAGVPDHLAGLGAAHGQGTAVVLVPLPDHDMQRSLVAGDAAKTLLPQVVCQRAEVLGMEVRWRVRLVGVPKCPLVWS